MAEPLSEGICIVEYAKSNRSSCKLCKSKIGKGSVRFGLRQRSRFHDGFETSWMHMNCGFKKRGSSITRLSQFRNWTTVKYDDQRKIKTHTGELKSAKEEALEEAEQRKIGDLVKQIKDNFTLDEMLEMLAANRVSEEQIVGVGDPKKYEGKIVHCCADGLLHGALEDCPGCNNSTLILRAGKLICFGALSGYMKCPYVGQPDKVKRYEWMIPKSLKSHEWLASWLAAHPTADEGTGEETKVEAEKPEDPDAMEDAEEEDDEEEEDEQIDYDSMKVAELKKELKDRGKVLGKKRLRKAQLVKMLKQVVEEEEEAEPKKKKAKKPKKKKQERIKVGYVIRRAKLKRKPPSVKTDEGPKKKKRKTKKKAREPAVPGSAILMIDEDCHRAGGQILVEGLTVWNAPLTMVDLKEKTNKFYKIQLIRFGGQYKVFTKWGRTGVTDGSYKRESKHSDNDDFRLTDFTNVSAAKAFFDKKFVQFTGNDWETHDDFEKIPGKYLYIELSRGNEEVAVSSESKSSKDCLLEPRLKSMVDLIFDGKIMKEALLEANVDLENMPLGRLDYDQIIHGYQVLKEVEQILDDQKRETAEGTADDAVAQAKLQEACTRFFTVIPALNPAIIADFDELKKRMEMMDVLMDLEQQSSIKEKQDVKTDKHQTDKNYGSLNTELKAMDKNDEGYKMVVRYIENHHHKNEWGYDLKVLDVFTVCRSGEEDIYKSVNWHKDKNRQLLWHGSRVTNFMGILSQGLRIAPPEAPKSGYLFGKGVYFANMVSKSSNYCRTTRTANTGIMMLSEVALGDMFEVTSPFYMEKAQPGTHSTKCMGENYPDPAKNETMSNGCVVPLGKKGRAGGQKSGYMGYDELIVYDNSQINMKYLVKLDFQYSIY